MNLNQFPILAGLATAILSTSALSAMEGWMTDFEAAKKKAAEEKKSLYLNFTGSDW